MTDYIILLLIVIPFVAGVLTLLIPQRLRGVKEAIALLATAATLWLSIIAVQTEYNLVGPLGWLWNRVCISAVPFQRFYSPCDIGLCIFVCPIQLLIYAGQAPPEPVLLLFADNCRNGKRRGAWPTISS